MRPDLPSTECHITTMLNELLHITSTEPYISNGGMRIKEISIMPWNKPDAKFVFEIWTDDKDDTTSETWEVTCIDLAQTDGIPLAIIPTTRMKLYDNHPVLWNFDDEVYFSIMSQPNSIPALIGELFKEHINACGNWVDFKWLGKSLPKTLETLRENQLSIPARLKDVYFQVFDRYGVKYRVNDVELKENKYRVLFFSNADIWPDEENFKQSCIIAKEFSERRLG